MKVIGIKRCVFLGLCVISGSVLTATAAPQSRHGSSISTTTAKNTKNPHTTQSTRPLKTSPSLKTARTSRHLHADANRGTADRSDDHKTDGPLAGASEQPIASDVLQFSPLSLDPEPAFEVVPRSMLSGLWGMTIPGKTCVEMYNFQDNGQMLVKSSKEWTWGKYELELPEAGSTTLPILTMKILYDNLETDCSGNQIDQYGEVQQQYVKWTGRNTIEFCNAPDGTQCVLTLNKVLP